VSFNCSCGSIVQTPIVAFCRKAESHVQRPSGISRHYSARMATLAEQGKQQSRTRRHRTPRSSTIIDLLLLYPISSHPHPRILENHSFNHFFISPPFPSFDSASTVIWIAHNETPNSIALDVHSFTMEQQQNPPPQGGVPGPAGRRLHIAHRRSPSELTPLMSMFSSPGSKFSTFVVIKIVCRHGIPNSPASITY